MTMLCFRKLVSNDNGTVDKVIMDLSNGYLVAVVGYFLAPILEFICTVDSEYRDES